jgi:hypothetical protein
MRARALDNPETAMWLVYTLPFDCLLHSQEGASTDPVGEKSIVQLQSYMRLH